MIKIQTLDLVENIEHIVVPTIFPDGTSQVWKLPKEIIDSLNIKVTWYFEAERELIDLLSLKLLFEVETHIHLHIPFLPYARQDKNPSNESTYNLRVFADILNQAGFDLVTSIDVHNSKETTRLINNFKNIQIDNFIKKSQSFIATDGIVYPDYGASIRYAYHNEFITCNKKRDQKTGTITGHFIDGGTLDVKKCKRLLIVDDICDGGATFISIAKMLKKLNPKLFIDLYITHGIFSKGKQVLLDAGIDNIYTTNSILKNVDGFKV